MTRVALILMDYPRRQRLKIVAPAETKDIIGDNGLATRVAMRGYRAKVEGAILLHLRAFDWNRPQHITPPFAKPNSLGCWRQCRPASKRSNQKTRLCASRSEDLPS
jgi:hypothetical protein